MSLVGTALRLVLVIDQIRNDVGLADVNQEAVADDDGSLELSEGTVALTEIPYLVEAVEWVELDVKLASLVVVSSAHHGVDRWLLLTGVGIVWIVAWYDEVVHLFFEDLLASGVLYVAAGGSCSILAAHVVVVVLNSILNAEVGVSVELLPPGAILISRAVESLSLLRDDAHRVDHHSEILLQVGGAQDLQLQCLNAALLNKFGKHLLPTLCIIMEVILDFL